MDSRKTLKPNESQANFCVTVKEDLIPEESETFYCSLSILQGSAGIARVTVSQTMVTIEDNDGKYKTVYIYYVIFYFTLS